MNTSLHAGAPRAVLVAIGAAWAAVLAVELTGNGRWLGHDVVAAAGVPVEAALPLFLASWTLMIVAMMLPTSLPLVRLVAVTARDQPDRARVMAAFLAGYAAIWFAFGLAALAGDRYLHLLVDNWAWLARRQYLILAAVLALAGAFQFSDLKDRCLTQCRHPAAFLVPRYRRGPRGAFGLGRAHGAHCLGCCWGLMLLLFAVGTADLVWMVALGTVMLYEKSGRNGAAFARVVGVALLVAAGVVLVAPGLVPDALAATG